MLLRSYVVLVGGLVTVGLLLDFGLARLESRDDPVAEVLAANTLKRIGAELSRSSRDQWPVVADRLGQELGFEVRVLPAAHLVGEPAAEQVREVEDEQGRIWFLREIGPLDIHVQIGPFEPPGENRFRRWIPPLFYLSVFALVGIWLWPLAADLNLISQSAQRFAGDYRQSIQTAGRTRALHELAENLDQMSARIQSLIRNQKELTSALSHEMRTPLARIRFAMAVMEDKRDVAAELDSIAADVAEIDGLIAAMLEYARLDHPGTEVDLEAIPAGPWLESCADKARGLGPLVSVHNELQSDTVTMDARLMGLALSNLLVNAGRYGDRQIAVTLAREGDQAVLHVDDDGPGIPPQQREKVFDAFTRLDDSRSKDTGGHGLGLAIVARIAALHGGTVEATVSPLGGARLTVRWPGGFPV